MDKKYTLFDYQIIIAALKEKHNEEKNSKKDENIVDDEIFEELMDSIDEDSIIEDSPFYQDYLSLFDTEQAFADYNLDAEEETMATKDDLFLLFKLIAASISSSYNILYDKSSNSIDFSITVKIGEQSITRSVSELFSYQIESLFLNYIGEQVNLYVCNKDPDYTQEIETEQKMRLMIFEKKMRQLQDLQDTQGILSDLDDLLNS